MRYTAENMEGEREGDPTDYPPHQAWDTLSSRIRRMRRHGAKPAGATTPLDRKDALTRRPLDFDQEEETRKVETSKWLEHHFGSDSRSSKDSVDDDDLPPAGRNTSFINVTMKSRPITGRVVSPVNGVTSTQVNGTFFPTPQSKPSPHSANATFQRISSPVNGNSNSPSFNANTSGFSSPAHGVSRNGLKSSNVSSPVNGTSTPRSFIATVNSSSRVFVSTPESEEPPPVNSTGANGYFHGVTEWSERRNGHSHSSPGSSLQRHPDRVQVLPTGPNHSFGLKARATSPYQTPGNYQTAEYRQESTTREEIRSSPFQAGNHTGSRHNLNHSPYNADIRQEARYEYRSPSPVDHRTSPHPLREEERGASPGFAGGQINRNGRQTNGWAEHEEDGYRGYNRGPGPQEEPDPDYSPPTQHRKESPEGESPPSTVNKKLYQRTRFAADIPPPTQSRPAARSKSPGNIIGDSFRKLVGKFRSSSIERKNKRAAAKAAKQRQRQASRSPSPRRSSPTYQQYNVIDSNIPCAEGVRVGADQPVAPPRPGRGGSLNQREDMERPVMHKYYLGEDPFGGSIYGREKEYDGVTPVKRRSHRHRRGSHEEDDMNRANMSQVVTTSTLGRVSKSSSRLLSSSPDYTRTSQTLPRKLHHEERTTTVTTRPAGINVSIVNNVTPAKPARTYRSNLSRSQSFNVHQTGGPRSSMYTSNPALNRLGDSPAPLKSPAILASISRSQRDLTATALDEDETATSRFSRSTSNLLNSSPPNVNPKKQLFMDGLADRAPELFKTLHGDEMRQSSTSPSAHIYTSTPVRTTRVVETSHTSSTGPLRNGYAPSSLRNGLIMDSRHSNGSASPVRNGSRLLETSYTNRSSAYTNGNAPIRNGRIVESSNSFRSSSTNDSDPVKHLSSPYRPVVNGDRVTSPSLYVSTVKGDRVHSPLGYSSSLTHSPVDGTTTSRSVVRRGSGDDYSETIRIKSKNDDPLRPSETNTIQSFSKKVVPMRGGTGRATEVVESSERTTVTKSSFRGGNLDPGYTSRNGGVVIPVRPTRK